ncbi:hypothetical protein F2P56_005908, partial [Juglans regia]
GITPSFSPYLILPFHLRHFCRRTPANLGRSGTGPTGALMEDDAIMKGDKLILRGLKFHGYHGVKAEERKLGQKFLVDVDAWMDLLPAGKSDNLSDTVSYTDIYRLI